MKTEKIIETIKVAAAEVEWNYPLDYTIALNEAAELLEKQVPKKPLIKKYAEEWGYWTWKCPNCGDEWLFRYNYCSSCGQRLDWSEEYA
ncbi:MAG: hypothetical protein ACOCM4_10025 [Acetivibrio ethanolgignens]